MSTPGKAPAFALRRCFQHFLGEQLMAYVLHLRPREWPILTAHFLLGALMAAGWQVFRGGMGLRTLLGGFVFVVLLNGGTLAINSAFDQDEGDIGYLKAPPKPPRHLLHVSALMLAASLGLGFLLPRVFAWSNAACVLMSVMYSVPPLRLKARAGWDLLINMLGFGLLTPLAGWGLTEKPVPTWFWAVVIGFAFLFGALYPATQVYQMDEDRARGDRTLVIRLGETASLWGALALALAAHASFAWALLRHHALPTVVQILVERGGTRASIPVTFPGGGLSPWWLGLSLLSWTAVLLPWCLKWRRMSQAQHEAGMYRLLPAWADTDLSLLAMLWPN